MKTSTYNVSRVESINISNSLKSYLCANNYIVQEFNTSNGLILQVKKGGGFKTILGLATATNITIDQYEYHFTVSFSEGRWADKAVVAGVSIFLLWPLLITSAVGAYNQAELPNKIIEFINGEVNKCYKNNNMRF